jgi:hypothetical protein
MLLFSEALGFQQNEELGIASIDLILRKFHKVEKSSKLLAFLPIYCP